MTIINSISIIIGTIIDTIVMCGIIIYLIFLNFSAFKNRYRTITTPKKILSLISKNILSLIILFSLIIRLFMMESVFL